MLFRLLTATGCFAAAAVAVTYSQPPIPLARAHQLHPRDTAITLELGLEQERSGQLAAAEATLLAAARADRQYLPAWTLANFYFRRDNPAAFWTWAARAATINRYDLRPLIRLASTYEPDADTVIARLGDRPEILRPYLDVLIGEHRLAAASRAAAHLAAHRDPADFDRLRALELRKIPSSARR